MKYDIILADPAWRFNVWSRDTGLGRTADSHYETMTLEQIKALPVELIAKDNSMLFLWATLPMIPEALEVGAAWGFKYVTTAFVWAKLNKNWQGNPLDSVDAMNRAFKPGMGYYTRANAEIVMLFRRGKGLPRCSKGVRQLIVSPIQEHSRKPDETYRRIEDLYGSETSKIELFARRPYPGWVTLGNAINGLSLEKSLVAESYL